MINIRHMRHGRFARARYQQKLLAFVNQQAARLGVTAQAIWAQLTEPGSSLAVSNAAGTNAAPTNYVLPSISGTVHSGSVLTANPGEWYGFPLPTYTYQWKQAGVNISSGGTAATYTVVSGDIGKALTVAVTATNTQGNATATSASVTPAA